MRATTAVSRRDDDVSSVKSDMGVMRWMVGFALAFQVAISVKLFAY